MTNASPEKLPIETIATRAFDNAVQCAEYITCRDDEDPRRAKRLMEPLMMIATERHWPSGIDPCKRALAALKDDDLRIANGERVTGVYWDFVLSLRRSLATIAFYYYDRIDEDYRGLLDVFRVTGSIPDIDDPRYWRAIRP